MAEISIGREYPYCYWVGEKIRTKYVHYPNGKRKISGPLFERPIDPKTGKLATDAVYKKMASKHQKKLQKEAENQSVLISDPTLTLAESG